MDLFTATVEMLLRREPPPDPLPEEPPELADRPAFERGLVVLPPPAGVGPGASVAGLGLSLDAAREVIDTAIARYLAEPNPDHLLLLRAAPGVGKTRRAVRTAEALAQQGQRVLYAGPRHAFYHDVLAQAEHPDLWWEWLPRQRGDPDTGKPATCLHVDAITNWIQKGYDGMSFCAAICGMAYVDDGCAWHAQKRQAGPIIFGQHAHVLAHPLRFHTVIGDESPIAAFLHEWSIPGPAIVPDGIDPSSAIAPLLCTLDALSRDARNLAGTPLLDLLGGAGHVLELCEAFSAAAGAGLDQAAPLVPPLQALEDAERAAYFHLPALVGLLRGEARAQLAGGGCAGRVILSGGRLILLQRRAPSQHLPPHVLWLDGTASTPLYEVTFGRRARAVDALPGLRGTVRQVWSRANGKSYSAAEAAIRQLREQVRTIMARGYRRAALITYQEIADKVAPGLPALHFYAARGTNVFEDCDALIVAGTPMPHPDQIARTARMLFAERTEPFNPRWSTRVCPYAYVDARDGQGRGYPAGGFWDDPDLQALLWSFREAELIQAVHRGRPVLREVDIWLLSNLPLPELPPAELLSLHELLGAPENTQPHKWNATMQAFERLAEQLALEKPVVSARDLAEARHIDPKTAAKYLRLLAGTGEWELCKDLDGQAGRPGLAVRRPEVRGRISKAATEGNLGKNT